MIAARQLAKARLEFRQPRRKIAREGQVEQRHRTIGFNLIDSADHAAEPIRVQIFVE
ncbi:hypothetical protein T190_05810 [Sinorhizobium meliloti CCBAU 01290]|nr:hypothetical protein T190_05810 [Sinorhizobium meliloti CCBAU 01290]